MGTQVGNVIFAISADLKGVQGQLRTLEGSFNSSFGKIQGMARNLAGTLGIGLGIGAFVAFGKSVVDVADKITDLADQTGLSVAVLGGMRPILEQNNSSVEQFAKGIQFAQKSLGDITGTGKEAAEALGALGLNVKELQNSTPDQFLEKFVAALGKVENQNDRAAVAFKVLGRAGVELIPTILQLAENGIPKLSREVEEAYKTLGRMADQVVVLTAKLVDLAAVPIASFFRFFGVGATAADGLRQELAKVNAEIENIDKLLARNRSASDFTFGLFNSPETRQQRRAAEEQTLLQRRSDAVSKLIDLNDQLIRSEQKAKPGDFKNLAAGAEKANKTLDQTHAFLAGIEKQLSTIEGKKIESLFGPQAALGFNLDEQFKAFKQKLTDEKLPIPKDLEESFARIREQIMASDQAYRDLQADLSGNIRMQALDDLDREFGELLSNIDRTRAATAAELKGKVGDLEKELTLELLSETERRQEIIRREVDERLRLIEQWRLAAIAAGQDVTEATMRAAQLSAQAVEAGGLEIKKITEDVDKFQERAFERLQDLFSTSINDVLAGNIKSWQEWGDQIKKVIDGIVSEFLSLQLKNLIFGPQFGASGGGSQMGGLLGGLLGWLFGGSGGDMGIGDLVEGMGYHKGGTVGEAGHPRRAVSPRLFVAAPRYHQGGIAGLMPDERAIIAKVGEQIIPAGKSAGMGAVTFGPGSVIIQANDPGSFRRSQGHVIATLATATQRALKRGY